MRRTQEKSGYVRLRKLRRSRRSSTLFHDVEQESTLVISTKIHGNGCSLCLLGAAMPFSRRLQRKTTPSRQPGQPVRGPDSRAPRRSVCKRRAVDINDGAENPVGCACSSSVLLFMFLKSTSHLLYSYPAEKLLANASFRPACSDSEKQLPSNILHFQRCSSHPRGVGRRIKAVGTTHMNRSLTDWRGLESCVSGSIHGTGRTPNGHSCELSPRFTKLYFSPPILVAWSAIFKTD